MAQNRQKVVRFEPPGRRKKQPAQLVLLAGVAFLISIALGIASLWVWPVAATQSPDEPILALFSNEGDPDQPRLQLCGSGQRVSCVVDGDTIWLRGEKIRVADIDTPEVGSPQCNAEYELGMQATYRLRDLLNEGPWSAERIGSRDEDQYGRKLRVLTRDGQSIGDMLVAEGLARTWTGRREPWC